MDWVDKSMRHLIISFVYLTRDISNIVSFFYVQKSCFGLRVASSEKIVKKLKSLIFGETENTGRQIIDESMKSFYDALFMDLPAVFVMIVFRGIFQDKADLRTKVK